MVFVDGLWISLGGRPVKVGVAGRPFKVGRSIPTHTTDCGEEPGARRQCGTAGRAAGG